jgi:transposase InsO family protein
VSRVINTLRPAFGVEPVCRALQVPTSTYYARRNRAPSARALRDHELVGEIQAARAGYRRVYGVRKTWKELLRRGIECGRDRIGRLMRAEGLEGVGRGRRPRTTMPAECAAERARDLVERRFVAKRPNALWVADLTYIRTFVGFCYLAFILDVFSRRIVGWQIASHMRTELVLDALEMAVALRQPQAGLVAHSDRGSQYVSLRYTDRLDELGIAPSVGSRGDAYDNAMAEAWVGTFKAELVAGRRFASFEQAEHEALCWIGFYNAERLHEELGDIPPDEFEANWRRRAGAGALSGDLRPSPGPAQVLVPPFSCPSGRPRPSVPALVGGTPAGLEERQHAT